MFETILKYVQNCSKKKFKKIFNKIFENID